MCYCKKSVLCYTICRDPFVSNMHFSWLGTGQEPCYENSSQKSKVFKLLESNGKPWSLERSLVPKSENGQSQQRRMDCAAQERSNVCLYPKTTENIIPKSKGQAIHGPKMGMRLICIDLVRVCIKVITRLSFWSCLGNNLQHTNI